MNPKQFLLNSLEIKKEKAIKKTIKKLAEKSIGTIHGEFNLKITKQTFSLSYAPGPIYGTLSTFLTPSVRRNIPFPMFGSYDYFANYKLFAELIGIPFAGELSTLLINQWTIAFMGIYTGGYIDSDIFTSEAIMPNLTHGTLTIIYRYNLQTAPGTGVRNYYVISIASDNIAPGSIVNLLNVDTLFFNYTQVYFNSTDNEQYNLPLKIVTESILGEFKIDTLTIGAFKSPKEIQEKIIKIPLNFIMDRFKLWIYQFFEDTTFIEFDFNVVHYKS